jgi:hypothetical protein
MQTISIELLLRRRQAIVRRLGYLLDDVANGSGAANQRRLYRDMVAEKDALTKQMTALVGTAATFEKFRGPSIAG